MFHKKIFRNFFSLIDKGLYFSFFLLFLSHAVAAPPMPSNPYSEEAFQLIKNYYNIQSGLPHYQLKNIQSVEDSGVQVQTVRIGVEGYPDVVLVLKIPKNATQPLPAIVLFSGFQTGAQAVKLVNDPNSFVIVGFEYPWPIDFLSDTLKWDWKRMEVIPVLMAVALKWLHEQQFLDINKINVVSVSFGTLFYPLAQRILMDEKIVSRSTVFGYGGVNIADVVGNELQKFLGPGELLLAKLVVQSQTWFIEPKYHLQHLRGPFLIVNGVEDNVFPDSSKRELIEKLVDPKKIITVPGGHIQPDRPEIIQKFMSEVFTFLKETDSL